MADDENKKTGHTLADHLYGRDVVHSHADDTDHDHDHDFEVDDGPIEDNPLWRQDNVSLTTVGIDIGSSGTQVIFSRVHLRRLAEDLTSRYYVVARETLFQSPVALTPYQSEERIDDAKLGAIIDDAYGAAGLTPDQHRYRRRHPDRRSLAARQCRRASPRSLPSKAANSSPRPPAITWRRCSRPTVPAPRGCRATSTSASSISISAAAPPSLAWSTTAK